MVWNRLTVSGSCALAVLLVIPLVTAESFEGDAEKGRTLFNGKGLCFGCHGKDAYRDRIPPRFASEVNRLNPSPPDLRKVNLRAKSEEDLFEIIREGIPGNIMVPPEHLTDAEIRHLVAYLRSFEGE